MSDETHAPDPHSLSKYWKGFAIAVSIIYYQHIVFLQESLFSEKNLLSKDHHLFWGLPGPWSIPWQAEMVLSRDLFKAKKSGMLAWVGAPWVPEV